jgi:hypothetical protein
VPKSDAGSGVSKLDESFAVVDRTRPEFEVAQAEGSGGEPMTAEARRQYVNLKRVRYQASNSRTERGQMLRELIDDGIYKNIKSANHAMLEIEEIGCRISDRGRKPIYTEATKVGLKEVWLSSGMPNSLRLKSIMSSPSWMKEFHFSDEVTASLMRLGKTTIDEYTKPWRIELRRRLNTETKAGNKIHLKGIITQRVPFVKITEPGFFETDTVSHGGGWTWGNYGYTVNTTDIFTGWTSQRMIKGKTAAATVNALEEIFGQLPMNIMALYFDSGSEFLNYEMEERFGKKMKLQHSRPQKKNDQAHIEQKNDTHVRQLLGYKRYEEESVIKAVNDLYANEWSILNNYFMPQMKLKEKMRIKSKLRKTYDTPKTPLERLLESKVLTSDQEKELLKKRDSYNPVELRKIVDQKVKVINEMLQATDNQQKAG